MLLDEGPALDEANMRETQDRMRAGMVQRTLYPAHVLDSPHRCVGCSRGSRLVRCSGCCPMSRPSSPSSVTRPSWPWRSGDSRGRVCHLARPLVVRLHAAYFDLLWAHAQPIVAALGDHKDDDRLLELLALGFGTRSSRVSWVWACVRCGVALPRSWPSTGADTRYQLGLAVGQREKSTSIVGR